MLSFLFGVCVWCLIVCCDDKNMMGDVVLSCVGVLIVFFDSDVCVLGLWLSVVMVRT